MPQVFIINNYRFSYFTNFKTQRQEQGKRILYLFILKNDTIKLILKSYPRITLIFTDYFNKQSAKLTFLLNSC